MQRKRIPPVPCLHPVLSSEPRQDVKPEREDAGTQKDTLCSPERFAAIVPATPDDRTCVVLTGSPIWSAAGMAAIATISADAPCPLGQVLLFSPTVTTIRFQPIIVPNPSASVTANFTQ